MPGTTRPTLAFPAKKSATADRAFREEPIFRFSLSRRRLRITLTLSLGVIGTGLVGLFLRWLL